MCRTALACQITVRRVRLIQALVVVIELRLRRFFAFERVPITRLLFAHAGKRRADIILPVSQNLCVLQFWH